MIPHASPAAKSLKNLTRLRVDTTAINTMFPMANSLSILQIDFSFIWGQYRITGRMNPMIGLIELPTRVMAEPMFGMTRARALFTITRANVARKFYFVVIPSS